MNRTVITIGIVVIVGMCLIPPMKTERYNAAADAFGQNPEEVNIEYRPVWSEPEDTGVTVAHNSTLASTRLLLQIVVVSLLTGGISYLVAGSTSSKSGSKSSNNTAYSSSQSSSQRKCKRTDKFFPSDVADCPHCGQNIDAGDPKHPRVD